MTLTRRELLVSGSSALVGTLAVDAFGRPAAAQAPDKMNILSHRVHKIVSTGPQGGDITAEWSKKNGVAVEWLTFDTGPLQERLFREASLRETTIGVAFLLNTQATPTVTNLFEPLDEYLKADPIEDFGDFFPGMVEAMKFGGKLYAVPFRHATSGLHYNEEFLKERGLQGPPRTIEDFAEYAKKLTYTRADGTHVTGLVLAGVTYPNVVDLARAWNGDFITPDYQVVANQAPMVRAVSLLRELYQAGAFPKGFATIQTEDVNTWMQTGRGAMCVTSLGRNSIYNDPTKSKFAGKIKATTIPISREFLDKFEVAPAKVEFWALVIPRNARNKKLSWSLVKEMSSKPNTLKAALNGNGPVRNSTYDDPRFSGKLPYAEEERRVLKVARAPMPAFDNAQKASDIFREEAEAAVLGFKTPQKAMDDVVARVRPLLPR